jgi:hypothetical protein
MTTRVNVQNVVVEPAVTAGACAGFLAGAVIGTKVATTFWWLGPVAYPVAIFVGGTVGAVGGGNLGKVIASQLQQ